MLWNMLCYQMLCYAMKTILIKIWYEMLCYETNINQNMIWNAAMLWNMLCYEMLCYATKPILIKVWYEMLCWSKYDTTCCAMLWNMLCYEMLWYAMNQFWSKCDTKCYAMKYYSMKYAMLWSTTLCYETKFAQNMLWNYASTFTVHSVACIVMYFVTIFIRELWPFKAKTDTWHFSIINNQQHTTSLLYLF